MNIYIGNLNYRVRENELQKRLEEYGAVDSVKVIKDRETGRSKGYAFAEMPNTAELSALDETHPLAFAYEQCIASYRVRRAVMASVVKMFSEGGIGRVLICK